jgi:hypothetical protein
VNNHTGCYRTLHANARTRRVNKKVPGTFVENKYVGTCRIFIKLDICEVIIHLCARFNNGDGMLVEQLATIMTKRLRSLHYFVRCQ